MENRVLEEIIDTQYQPTQEDVTQYAKWLGMHLPEDQDFLYIARQGLKASIPQPWKPCQTDSGTIYFFNFQNGESTWQHPCDTVCKSQFQQAKKNRAAKPIKSQNQLKIFRAQLEKAHLQKQAQRQQRLKAKQKEIRERIDREIQRELQKIEQNQTERDQNLRRELKDLQERETKKTQLQIDLLKQEYEIQTKKIRMEIQEQKELIERQSKKTQAFESDLQQELAREKKRTQLEFEQRIEEFEQELKLKSQSALAQIKERESQVQLQIQAEELKQKFQSLLVQRKKEIDTHFQEQIEKLENQEVQGVVQSQEVEVNKALSQMMKEYELNKRDRMIALDKQFSNTFLVEKAKIEEAAAEKSRILKEKHKPDYRDLEEKIRVLQGEIADIRNKIINKDLEIARLEGQVKSSSPSRLDQLEMEIQELKKIADFQSPDSQTVEFDQEYWREEKSRDKLLQNWRIEHYGRPSFYYQQYYS